MTALQVRKMFGALRRVSPEEHEAALLVAIAGRIEDGAGQAELMQWRKVLLTVDYEFIVLPSLDDCYFKSVNLRRAVIMENEAVVRSSIQQIQEIIEFKHRKEKGLNEAWSAERLCEEWSKHAIQISSKYAEEIKVTWIENAVHIYNRLLSDKTLRELCLSLESEYGKKSPLNSTYSLDAICNVCKTYADLQWTLEMMTDCLKFNGSALSEFSYRSLKGNPKGVCHLFVFKRLLMDYLSTWLVTNGFGVEQAEVLKSLQDAASFRKMCGGAGMKVDLQWQALKSQSTRLVFLCLFCGPHFT